MTSNRADKSGFRKEISDKLSAKYDAHLAGECLQWLKESINGALGAGQEAVDFSTDGSQENFGQVLHNGVVLARMANILVPGSVSAKKLERPPTLPFKQMELIEVFIRKVKEFGVPDHENFQTVDLFEEQNLHQVVICLQSTSRKAKAKGLHGFGPTESTENRRSFTDEQLRAGQSVVGLQMGSNKGASQAGMNIGKSRHIVD